MGITETMTRCKMCGDETSHFFSCDFHNNTNYNNGLWASPVNLSGKQVDYVKCLGCECIFTTLMDNWTPEQFRQRVYNKDYPHLDNDYQGARGARTANLLWHSLNKHLTNLTFLDYGGGYGIQTDLLKKYGAREAISYDPFTDTQRPDHKFDVVTCSEVLEHSTDPAKTVKDLMEFVKDDGIIFATTLLIPDDIEDLKQSWWYISPRVGHVSFYTKSAIQHLYRGMSLIMIGNGAHIAFKSWPEWAHNFSPKVLENV